MQNVHTIIEQVLVIYLMILVGFYARKIKIINSQVNFALAKLVLNICLPFYIISSFNYEFSLELLFNMLIILIFGLLIHPICYIIGLFIYHKYPKASQSVFVFAMVFSNCGYMAFPLLDSLYGKIGIIYGAVFLATFNIYLWTIGITIYNKEETKQRFRFLNPGIIAVTIGVLLYVFSIRLPTFLASSIETMGKMTTPLSMFIIGAILADIRIKDLFKTKAIYFNSIIRLIVIPIIAFFALKPFHLDPIIYGICVLLSGMPVAVTSPIFAERYQGDKSLASITVFISTLISVITIPLLGFLLSL